MTKSETVLVEQALTLSRKAADVFKDKGIANARLESELLLASVLGIDRLKLYLQHDRPVTPAELDRFREYCRRRIKREPVQYIIGTVAFREIELAVDRRALIPRPETELLVGEVLKYATASERSAELLVLDIGTGTGAIALSIAHEAGCRVVATDVSEDALSLARENAGRTGLADRVELRRGSLWEPVAADEIYDVIVSNPPYIGESERAGLAPEVVDHEPASALFAQDGGMAVLFGIVDGAFRHLRSGGLLAVETGFAQGPAVVERLAATGKYTAGRIVRDYAGHDRIVTAEAL